MYGMTILETEDLLGDLVIGVMHAMSSRYSDRLGVNTVDLTEHHRSMSASAAKLRNMWLTTNYPDLSAGP